MKDCIVFSKRVWGGVYNTNKKGEHANVFVCSPFSTQITQTPKPHT